MTIKSKALMKKLKNNNRSQLNIKVIRQLSRLVMIIVIISNFHHHNYYRGEQVKDR